MDYRMPLTATTTRPLPPQRAVSGSAIYFQKSSTRPTLPSRLSSVRSVSQPSSVVDLTADGAPPESKYDVAYWENEGKAVVSPEVIALDEDSDERPAKRIKVEGDSLRDRKVEGATERARQIVAAGQMPGLPKQSNISTTRAVLARRQRNAGEYAARKANGLEPPSMATRLPAPKTVADFSPWTGNHPEDVLNEAVVKAGYCDKGPGANQSECNSAKPSIWANLTAKNNPGLQMLSVLFTQVMDKRQALGKCTAPSTFKPPPRVTVTDTKREAWLRDLANPDVPLRKQSRTIPHGIRGKLLMEQCLSKDIPLQRAVWLAKCVGANELRAFRRKGVSGAAAASGESKWVREWTVQVEQFMEGVIAACGEQDWQLKMNYAVKLATAFYTEKLLEVDHYLDWVVSSFADATPEQLPIWIILVQIYWKDIVRFTRRGRRLAEAILERLNSLGQDTTAVNEALRTRLQKLVAVLAITSRGCLVIPHTWEKYKHLLTPTGGSDSNHVLQSMAAHLAERNERLAGLLQRTPSNTRSILLQLYDKLDAVGLQIDMEETTQACLALLPNTSDLVTALLDWASTPFRHGLARIYLTARIIAGLRAREHATDAAILAYLQQTAVRPVGQLDRIYRVVRELVRLNAFAVGRYLQWLISTGAYASPDAGAAAGLLSTLPTAALPAHVAALKQTLLGRIKGAKHYTIPIEIAIAAFDAAVTGDMTVESTRLAEGTLLTVQVTVAAHVCRCIQSAYATGTLDLRFFCIARRALEGVEDMSSLASLVKLAVNTDDTALLATATDSVVLHAEAFAALGALEPLIETMLENYRILRASRPLDRTLIVAMTGLARLLEDDAAALQMLSTDVVICEQQNTAAVCSPASDNLIGMHADALDSEADIDAVFASGNTMEDQLLQRVFMRVLQRANKPHSAEAQPASKISSWLNQLRVLGGTSFEQLVETYVHSVAKGNVTSFDHTAAIVALVASGCMTLDTVAAAAISENGPQAGHFALRLLLSPSSAASLSSNELYRFSAIQQRYRSNNIESVVSLLVLACRDNSFRFDDPAVADLLVAYMSRAKDVLKQAFQEARASRSLPADASLLARTIFKRALPAGSDASLDIRSVVSMADPLSIRFCAGLLRDFTKSDAVIAAENDSTAQAVVMEAIQSSNSVWPQLLGSAVSDQTKRGLHEWARNQLLFAVARVSTDDGIEVREVVSRYLDVLDLTSAAVRVEDDTVVLAALSEKLRDVERQLSELDDAAGDQSGRLLSIRRQLHILLHMCTLHAQPSTSDTEGARQARGNLLMALCSLIGNATAQMQTNLLEHIVDLASAIADTLSEEALANVARNAKQSDPRIQAILGTASMASDTWLALNSQVQPAGTAQQRALAKHASQRQQSQLSTRPGVLGQTATAVSPLQGQPPQRGWPVSGPNRAPLHEMKSTPYPLRRWEIMPDPTPVMGENDTSLSLGLFGARKV